MDAKSQSNCRVSEKLLSLKARAYQLRVDVLRATSQAGSGHPTTCLSAADIVAALFFDVMHYDPDNYDNPNSDRFILSKGHAAPLLYATWKQLGKVSDKELLTLRDFDSVLEGHPTSRFIYSEAATGSLGQGLSIGAGMACAAQKGKRNYRTFVLLGDSEMAEGSNWEAITIAAHYNYNNLVALVDCNRLGQSTEVIEGHDPEIFKKKFEAFGWDAIIVDGHDMCQVCRVLTDVRTNAKKPTAILAKTYKGYGLDDFGENKNGFHGKALPFDDLEEVITHMEHRFSQASFWVPKPYCLSKPDTAQCEQKDYNSDDFIKKAPSYALGDSVATRVVFGQALAAYGSVAKNIMSLDAEVKNSTHAQIFEQAYPDRFVQCFIAEQNMVGMGVGLAARGYIPVLSTFAAFFTRAYDQIRMAAVGCVPLRLVGSHAGVSIGEDGASQMGLEDLAIMRVLPQSIVLYPCDAVSAAALLAQALAYTDGISYVRTTRSATPVIYDASVKFPVGGCHVVRQSDHDSVCIVAAGITVFEALKAYETLKAKNIFVRVIDCYSIKPIPAQELIAAGCACNNQIVTVEDHYIQGGLGQAVCAAVNNAGIAVTSLAVTQLPRSGKPEELRAYAGIDANAIVETVLARI